MTKQTEEQRLFFGFSKEGAKVTIAPEVFLRHAVCLGASGSGKTVACKVFCEEMALQKIPIIALDPQGDIASLVLPGLSEEIEKHGLEPKDAARFAREVEVILWTPGSRTGVPLSLDPLRLGSLPERKEIQVRLLSGIAADLAAILGYTQDSSDGKYVAAYLDLVLQHLVEHSIELSDLSALARFLDALPASLVETTARIIQDKKRQEVSRKLEILGIGARRLLFQMGVPLDIDTMLGPRDPSAPTRLSVIYLNTLHSQEEKDFFVSQIAQALYKWMLEHPSPHLQAVFYLDEIAPYLPPIRKPACKDALKLLFKQARKYGIACLVASQNPGDIDYTALSQFSTWILGRMMLRQDLQKVERMIRSFSPAETDTIMADLPGLEPGRFILLSPDAFDRAISLRSRWLLTRHETLDEERIEELVSEELRDRWLHPAGLPPEEAAPSPPTLPPAPTSAPLKRKDAKPSQKTKPAEGPKPAEEDTEVEDEEEADLLQGTHEEAGAILRRFFEDKPGAYSIREITEALTLSEAVLRRQIRALVKAGQLSSAKIGRSWIYWLTKHRFDPSIGLIRMIATIPRKLTADDALKLAEKACERSFLGFLRKETPLPPQEDTLLLWQVHLRRISAPPTPTKNYTLYLHATTGEICSLEQRSFRFLAFPDRPLESFEDLAHFTHVSLLPPGSLATEPRAFSSIKTPSMITAFCQERLPGEVLELRLLALPLWRCSLQRADGRSRPYVVDGLFGYPLLLPSLSAFA